MSGEEEIDNVAQTFFLLLLFCSFLSDSHLVLHRPNHPWMEKFEFLFKYAFLSQSIVDQKEDGEEEKVSPDQEPEKVPLSEPLKPEAEKVPSTFLAPRRGAEGCSDPWRGESSSEPTKPELEKVPPKPEPEKVLKKHKKEKSKDTLSEKRKPKKKVSSKPSSSSKHALPHSTDKLHKRAPE